MPRIAHLLKYIERATTLDSSTTQATTRAPQHHGVGSDKSVGGERDHNMAVLTGALLDAPIVADALCCQKTISFKIDLTHKFTRVQHFIIILIDHSLSMIFKCSNEIKGILKVRNYRGNQGVLSIIAKVDT